MLTTFVLPLTLSRPVKGPLFCLLFLIKKIQAHEIQPHPPSYLWTISSHARL